MEKSSQSDKNSAPTMESIIGLGEASVRKNYFPSLQKKIGDLELLNSKYRTLIETIPDILLVYNDGKLSLFPSTSGTDMALVHDMLKNEGITLLLESSVKTAREEKRLVSKTFSFIYDQQLGYYEARANITEMNDALIIVRDITSDVISEKKLRDMVNRDALTHLYNRRYFEERLAEIDGKYCEALTLIIIDIDGLKIINDTMGHAAGDEIIVTMSDILKKVFDKVECIARIGGDEFGILMTGQEKIEELLKKINLEIRKYSRVENILNMSVSFGYSSILSETADLSMMFREADNKMYQNKLLKENSNRSSIVKTLTKMLAEKDFITQGHAQRMEKLAVMMGKELGLQQDMLDRLELLAKFHDIGKVGIPDSILLKPGRLTDNEWEIMKSHSIIGKRVAETSPELRDISQLILLHHERYDSTGYPLGLKGENIPIECRILSIIDTFDAMTNDRPYRPALSFEETIEEIKRGAGSQFDIFLVDVFVRIVKHDIRIP